MFGWIVSQDLIVVEMIVLLTTLTSSDDLAESCQSTQWMGWPGQPLASVPRRRVDLLGRPQGDCGGMIAPDTQYSTAGIGGLFIGF